MMLGLGPLLKDFAHIPFEDTPRLPLSPPQRKKILHKVLVKHLGAHLPGGPVGEILDLSTFRNSNGIWFNC